MKTLLSCSILLVIMLEYSLESQAQVYFKTEYATPSSFKDEQDVKTGCSGDMVQIQGGLSLPLTYKQCDNGRI